MSKCPSQYDIGIRTTGVPICVNSIDTTKYKVLVNQTLSSFSSLTATFPVVNDLLDNIFNKKCAPYYIATTGLGGRCIPSLVSSDNIM